MLFTNTIHPKVLRLILTALAFHEYSREDLKVLHFASQPLPLRFVVNGAAFSGFRNKISLHILLLLPSRPRQHRSRRQHRFRRRATGVALELGSQRAAGLVPRLGSKRPLHRFPQIGRRAVGETHELGSQRPRHRFRRRAAGVAPELGSMRLQHRCRRRATGEACGLGSERPRHRFPRSTAGFASVQHNLGTERFATHRPHLISLRGGRFCRAYIYFGCALRVLFPAPQVVCLF